MFSTALWRVNKNTCIELLQEVENHQSRLFMKRRRSTRFLSDWMCFRFLSHCAEHKALSTTSHLKSHAKVPPSPHWGQICTWHPLIISVPNKIGQSILGSRPLFATFTLVLKNSSSRNSCSLLVKALTKLSQHGPPLPGGVSADTIWASTRIYALAPSQASFCSPTAVAGRLTGAHRTNTNPAGVKRCAGGRGRASNSYIRTDTDTKV